MSSTRLVLAARRGLGVGAVREILHNDNDPNINFTDALGCSPLYYSSALDDHASALLLLERGADPNSQDLWLETPLHASSSRGHLEIVKTLLKFGANANASDRFGRTPLRVVCDSSRMDEEKRNILVETLIAHGAEIDLAGVDGTTVLHAASNKKDNTRVVKCLLEHGADVNAKDKIGETPLHVACRRRNAEIVHLLLQHKANPNIQCSVDGWTALHLACSRGSLDCAQILVGFGASCCIESHKGHLPIVLAAQNKDLKSVQCLLLCTSLLRSCILTQK